MNGFELEGSDIRATTIVADPVSANEGRTYTHEGKNNFRTHNVVVDGGAKIVNVEHGLAAHGSMDVSSVSPSVTKSEHKGHSVVIDGADPFSFKASHFTRGKDGEPSAIMPPLSADADKGDQDAVIFQPTYSIGSHASCSDGDQTNRSHNAGGPVGFGIIEEQSPALRSERTQAIVQPQNEVAPTVNGTQRQQVDGVMAVDAVGIPRRLMPLECERLQGWADYWTDIPKKTILNRSDAAAAGVVGEIEYDFPSDAKRYRAVGNGVAKPVAQWIAWRIRLAAAEAYLTLSSQQESHE
jgi:hypothetical protein